MNKEIALNRLQNFLDKSSYHKWNEIQEALDFLKLNIGVLEDVVHNDFKIWEKGYQAGLKEGKK